MDEQSQRLLYVSQNRPVRNAPLTTTEKAYVQGTGPKPIYEPKPEPTSTPTVQGIQDGKYVAYTPTGSPTVQGISGGKPVAYTPVERTIPTVQGIVKGEPVAYTPLAPHEQEISIKEQQKLDVVRTYESRQQIQQVQLEWQKAYESIDSHKLYTSPYFPGQVVPGFRIHGRMKAYMLSLPKQELELQKAYLTRTREYEKTRFEESLARTPGGAIAAAFTSEDPLGAVSTYHALRGDTQAYFDVKQQAISSMRRQSFAEFYATSPFGLTTAITAGIAGGIAAPTKLAGGYVVGRYGAGSLASWGFTTAQVGVGGVFAGYAVADIEMTRRSEGTAAAVRKGAFLIPSVWSGYKGYQAGSSIRFRGASIGEWGYRAGFHKRITVAGRKGTLQSFDLRTGEIIKPKDQIGFSEDIIKASKLEFKLRRSLGRVKVEQADPIFEGIETLRDQPEFLSSLQKHLKTRKAEIFGSASEGRLSMHDIDIAYKRTLHELELRHLGGKLLQGKTIGDVADLKPWYRPGKVIQRMGTVKQVPVKTKSGYTLMRISESAMRHGETALEMQHVGRIKDVPRAVELYTKLFKAKGSPTKLEPVLSEYSKVMLRLGEQPLAMSQKESLFIYGKEPFIEKWRGFKQKVYKRILGYEGLEKRTQRFIGSPQELTSKYPSVDVLPQTISKGYSAFVSYPSVVSSAVPSVYPSGLFSPISDTPKYGYGTPVKPSYPFPYSKTPYSISPVVAPIMPSSYIPSSYETPSIVPSVVPPPTSPPYSPPPYKPPYYPPPYQPPPPPPYYPPPPKSEYYPPPFVPPAPPRWGSDSQRKVMQKGYLDVYGKGYRIRKWKMPTLAKLLGGK